MNVGFPVIWTTWVVISEGRGGRRAFLFCFVLNPETGPTGGVRNSGRSLWDWGGLSITLIRLSFFSAHHHPPPPPVNLRGASCAHWHGSVLRDGL